MAPSLKDGLDCGFDRVELPPDPLCFVHHHTIQRYFDPRRAGASEMHQFVESHRNLAVSHQYRGYANTGPG
jgi:hypothetical protein